MKKFLGLLLLLFGFTSNYGIAQNYQNDFEKYIQGDDTINQLKVLTEWEKLRPNDPELFISYFNYYFIKSGNETIAFASEPSGDECVTLRDSLKKVKGYLSGKIYYDQVELQKGFDKINKGIELFPNRLDMRFGKIYTYGKVKNWSDFTNTIIATVEYSSKNDNKWIWANNETSGFDKDFFLSTLQDYQVQLYNTKNKDLFKNMREISKEILKYYPNHVMSLSNLAVTYLLTKEYDIAIKILLKVEKNNPEDYIILSNIANCYKSIGDKNKAIEYYEKVNIHGNNRAKEFALKQIEELTK